MDRLHRIHPQWNLSALGFVALWAAGAWMAVPLLGWLMMALAINGLANLMHDGVHGNLFRHRRLDRWFAFLFGLPTMLSATAYRIVHLAHHRTTHTALDPDGLGPWTAHPIGFMLWVVVGMPIYLVQVPLHAIRRGHGRDVCIEYAIMAAIYIGLGLTVPVDTLLRCWLLPWSGWALFANLRRWAEHAEPSPYLTSSVHLPYALSLLNCHINYHAAHHLHPGIPWYNLRAAHTLLGLPATHTSYLSLLRNAIRINCWPRSEQNP